MNPAPPARRSPEPPHFERFLRQFHEVADQGRVVVLTGAGVSAESGLPTFRGPEGWWTVGSHRHRPEELATFAFFTRHPDIVWEWYLFRATCARRARPNPAHRALAEATAVLGPRLTLVTQNVDGLHRRAGSPIDRTFEIHGNLDWMRCAATCNRRLRRLPDTLLPWSAGQRLYPPQQAALRCPECDAWMRPHVLWFDEFYEEGFFRSESSLASVETADVFLVVGSSGATTLPLLMLQRASSRGIRVMVVDPAVTPFSESAGPQATLREAAGGVLPLLFRGLGSAVPGS